ncbi:hypothetical protein Alches_17790 [Alicyclobacillus hesperidum subsp. aegles]|nr:hypothetical protein Alches_17790 [Alicyclobacillus hesperidum subsp. aegles]
MCKFQNQNWENEKDRIGELEKALWTCGLVPVESSMLCKKGWRMCGIKDEPSPSSLVGCGID